MRTPILQNQSPGLKFLLTILVCFSMLVIFSMLGGFLASAISGVDIQSMQGKLDYNDPATMQALRIATAITNFGGFLMAAILFAWLCTNKMKDYFHVNTRLHWKYLWVVGLVFFLATPVVYFLSTINEMVSGGEFLSIVQDDTSELKNALLRTENTSSVIFNLFAMALLPAVGEELFFRGVVLRVAYQGTRKVHASVLMTAILFSIVHMEFDNFLAITFMGMVMGYLYIYTGNILVPMLLHLVNNSIYILLDAYGSEPIPTGAAGEESMQLIWLIAGGIFLVVLLWLLRRSEHKEKWDVMRGSLLRD